MSLETCPLCGGGNHDDILTVPRIAIHHVREPSPPVGERDFARLEIVACSGCGHVFNRTFEPGRFDDLYGGPMQSNVPVHATMSQAIVDARNFVLAERADKPTVMEIGGGAGHLSRVLAEDAGKVVLVEPSPALSQEMFDGTRVRLVPRAFPDAGIDGTFDIVACRQVLEHVADPIAFLAAIRERLRDGGEAYIEVPCMDFIETACSPFDFHYDHVQYFRRPLLEAAMRRVGLAPSRRYDIKDGHDVGYMAAAGSPEPAAAMGVPSAGAGLGRRLERRLEAARRRLQGIRGAAALYGATVYSQSFMGLFPEFDRITTVFDDTEAYFGHLAYGPSVAAVIREPTREALASVDAVIIAAYLHDRVIYQKLRELGYGGIVYSLRPDALAGTAGYPPPVLGE